MKLINIQRKMRILRNILKKMIKKRTFVDEGGVNTAKGFMLIIGKCKM